MFEPSKTPRIFGMPLGADFATGLVAGLNDKTGDMPPVDLARVEIFVNTSRMRRRIRQVFDAGPARLLPRIRLITDLANDPAADAGPPAASPLRRRLELSQFVAALLDQDPSLAPRAALYDLSDSLAKLMEEMHGEGVDPSAFAKLDVTDESGHWDRALKPAPHPTKTCDCAVSSITLPPAGSPPHRHIPLSWQGPQGRAAPPPCSCKRSRICHKGRLFYPASTLICLVMSGTGWMTIWSRKTTRNTGFAN